MGHDVQADGNGHPAGSGEGLETGAGEEGVQESPRTQFQRTRSLSQSLNGSFRDRGKMNNLERFAKFFRATQTLKSVNLHYTPVCSLITMFVLGAAFVTAAAFCLVLHLKLSKIEAIYSDPGDLTAACPQDSATCSIQFDLEKRIPAPVLFYYTLTNFHQNHRRFMLSKNGAMFRGTWEVDDEGKPVNIDSCTFASTQLVDGHELFLYPCGLIATSVFNDTFILSRNEPSPAPKTVIPWSKDGISWEYASRQRFHSKDEAWLRENCYLLGGDHFDSSGFPETLRHFNGTHDAKRSHYNCWHSLDDEDLHVWMQPSGPPDFWKLHRIIHQDLEPGRYTINIENNFPVGGFKSLKGFVLTNVSVLGANSQNLGLLMLVVGCGTLMMLGVSLSLYFSDPSAPHKPPEMNYDHSVEEAARDFAEAVREESGAAKPSLLPMSSLNLGGLLSSNTWIKTTADPSNEPEQRSVKCPPQVLAIPNPEFASNFVSTTKYTRWTFAPLNIFFQFQRFANVYFFAIAVMASFPTISPYGAHSFWSPLAFVIGFSALKDALEDYRRHLSDVEENGRLVEVFDFAKGGFCKAPWRDIQVGSLVRVTATDEDGCSPMIPADLALLACNEGVAFIETANLDGETNLKLREPLPETQMELAPPLSDPCSDDDEEHLQGEYHGGGDLRMDKVQSLQLGISCNLPDALIYDFNARLYFRGLELPLSGGSANGQLLQRSTKLRNTKWCIGVAVYTGKQTKIQMNLSDPPHKVSNIERKLNGYIFILFFILLTLCITGSILSRLWLGAPTTAKMWYLAPHEITTTFDITEPEAASTARFVTYIILLSMLIPISLYVSVEVVKTFLMFVISSDDKMSFDGIPAQARSAGLCEELGQVSYIFSDKTGTLTQNLMVFKKCSIAGIEYGRGYCEVERAIARRSGKGDLPDDPDPPEGVDQDFRFVDERLMDGRWRDLPTAHAIQEFFLNLALNHTAQVEYHPTNPTMPIFQAESPDEGAFVSAARNLGWFFCKRTMKDIVVKVSDDGIVGEGRDKVFTVLYANAFDNTRKRTSVVVRCFDERILLLVKGADTSVMPFCEACHHFAETQSQVDKFSRQGLRTLVFAGRYLSQDEYLSWAELVRSAALLSEKREEELSKLASAIEEAHTTLGRQSALIDASTPYTPILTIHGATALEDKLQEDVGECIENLSRANIKLWVLTGDKVETAVNIGYATALLREEMEPLVRLCREDLMELEVGWEARAGPLEIALDKALQRCKQGDVEGLAEVAEHAQLGSGRKLDEDAIQVFEMVEQVASKLAIRIKNQTSQSSDDSLHNPGNRDAGAGSSIQALSAERRRSTEGGEKTTRIGSSHEEWDGVSAEPIRVAGEASAKYMREMIRAKLAPIEAKLAEVLLNHRVAQRLIQLCEETDQSKVGGWALVIDGPCLRAAMHRIAKLAFLTVSVRCKAVLCCRVTPSQKALVTRLVKDNLYGKITLAIGDGANDVAMIQAAHLGIGIRGKEGQQAVLASDYALPQFAHLQRLLLVHGRLSYKRFGLMVCYFFYKNFMFGITQFWFAIYWNAFSAQALFDDLDGMFYTLVFTMSPCMIYAVLDRDVEDYVAMRCPEMYSVGQQNLKFSGMRFSIFTVGAFLHALVFFFITVWCIDMNASNEDGKQQSVIGAGTAVLSGVIVTANVAIGIHTHAWSWVIIVSYFFSPSLWFFYQLAYHSVEPKNYGTAENNVFWAFQEMAQCLSYWLTMAGTTALCIIPIFIYKYLREMYAPQIDEYYRAMVHREGDAFLEKIEASRRMRGPSMEPSVFLDLSSSHANLDGRQSQEFQRRQSNGGSNGTASRSRRKSAVSLYARTSSINSNDVGATPRPRNSANEDVYTATTADIVLGLQDEDGVISALPIMQTYPGTEGGAAVPQGMLGLRAQRLESEVAWDPRPHPHSPSKSRLASIEHPNRPDSVPEGYTSEEVLFGAGVFQGDATTPHGGGGRSWAGTLPGDAGVAGTPNDRPRMFLNFLQDEAWQLHASHLLRNQMVRRARPTLCDYTPTAGALFQSSEIMHQSRINAAEDRDNALRPLGLSTRETSSARMADFTLPPKQSLKFKRGHQRGVSEGGARDWGMGMRETVFHHSPAARGSTGHNTAHAGVGLGRATTAAGGAAAAAGSGETERRVHL